MANTAVCCWEDGKLSSYYTDNIPARLIESLEAYITERRPTGSFLRAVLHNDLRESVGRADPQSLAALPHLVSLLYTQAPAPCWGSPEAVEAWLAGGEEVSTLHETSAAWEQVQDLLTECAGEITPESEEVGYHQRIR
ncbi:MAG: hypothetical protein ACK47B_10750 [Armatimonadota bacterium]